MCVCVCSMVATGRSHYEFSVQIISSSWGALADVDNLILE